MLRLVETFFRTNRFITVENFFTSIPLANILWADKITLVCNNKANKSCITESYPKIKQVRLIQVYLGSIIN